MSNLNTRSTERSIAPSPSLGKPPKKTPPKAPEVTFEWSWKAFVGNKSTTNPDSPYYVPPQKRAPKVVAEVAEPVAETAGADVLVLNSSRSDNSTIFSAPGAGGSDTASSFTSPSVLRTLTLPSMPWSYAAAVKTQYLKRAEERALATLNEFEPLPLPSKVKAESPHTGPKFMFAFLDRPATAVPQYFAGFDATKYIAPLQPREGVSPVDSVKASAASTNRGGVNPKTKGKPLLFTKGAGNKVLPIIQRNTMEQLRRQPATIASIHDVMASDETPLAARGYAQMEADMKLAHRVKAATDKARLTSKLLQADAFTKQLKWQRTRGTKDYLRVERGKKITAGMQQAARRIQRSWKRYLARVTWASVRKLRPKVAVALIRTYTPDLTDAPIEGTMAARRRENKRISAAQEVERLEAEAHQREMDALLGPRVVELRRRQPKKPSAPRAVLAGEEFKIPRKTVEQLRNAALGWLKLQ